MRRGMICPHCKAENPDELLRCRRCGVEFPVFDDTETVAGLGLGDVPAPSDLGGRTAPAPVRRKSSSTDVITPPSGSTTPSGSSAWPSYGEGSFVFQPGTEFGPRYRIESLIGEGGMGTVYRAYDRDLDRIVALKLLRPELTAEGSAMKRFKQELLLASRISHKNILRIHDLGDAGGIKFISMAYVEGLDLHEQLKKHGRFPIGRAVNMARQLCAALEAAHAEGVVHRDLKPHNVLVDSTDTVYVSDFGLAKSLETSAIGMTRTGEYLGTPRYMAPEQVEVKPVDQRTDLYALGLILFEMVTGEVPFVGTSTLQVMYLRVKEKPKNPKVLNPELPDYLARIILRCLEKDPALRYQSARELLADLDAERASSMKSVRITLPLPRGRGWILAGGGMVLLLALALAIPGVRHRVLGPPADTTDRAAIPPLAKGKYVAVLPFRVHGDPGALGYVAEGLVEALSAKLFQLRDLRLASTAAVQEASKKESLEKIARALGVNLVVHGSVQAAGDRIRVVVNLEDLAGGTRLWSQEYPGATQDLLVLEDQMYAGLLEALELRPSREELARGTARPTGNLEAYDLYLRGRNAMRSGQEIKSLETAIQFFEEALEKDAGFALAYAGLADAGLQMYREKKEPLWAQRALGAAQQAQRLNDSLAEVHFSLGSVYNARGQSAEAISELKRALELMPNSDEGHRRLGNAYLAAGRYQEALPQFRRAVDLNPYYWANHNVLGGAYWRSGNFEEALAAFRRVTELEPENSVGYDNIGAVYFQQGKYQECIPAFEKALSLQPYHTTYSNLGTAYFFLKRYADAVKMFEKAVEMNPNEQLVVGNLADAYRWSGDPVKASATYDRAIALAFKELQVNPRDASTLGTLGQYYAKKGEPARALEYITRARSINRDDLNLIYFEAQIHSLGNRRDAALKSLRQAFRKGLPPQTAVDDPELYHLHTYPAFENLVKEFSGKNLAK